MSDISTNKQANLINVQGRKKISSVEFLINERKSAQTILKEVLIDSWTEKKNIIYNRNNSSKADIRLKTMPIQNA